MAKYTVIVSRRADQMLVRHARFLAQVSVPAAKRMIAAFEEVVDTLEKNPFQFPVEEEFDLPAGVYRKALFGKRYKAVFSVSGDTVYLDAVLDCRQGHTDGLPGM